MKLVKKGGVHSQPPPREAHFIGNSLGKGHMLNAVCIYNSFLSFDSLLISTIISFEAETSVQLYLQVKGLKALLIFFCGKPT